MAFAALAEALLRVEFKLDSMLRHLKVPTQPMHFVGAECPVCHLPIDYQVDVMQNVVVRKCNCFSGKYAPLTPITPVGAKNGDASSSGRSAAKDRDGG